MGFYFVLESACYHQFKKGNKLERNRSINRTIQEIYKLLGHSPRNPDLTDVEPAAEIRVKANT